MIIGLIGKAGSGKTTAADFLVSVHDFKKVSFAKPIKMILYKMGLFSWDELFNRKTQQSRAALQEFGEWVRKYDYFYWNERCREEIIELMSRGERNIVIDDVRRVSEAEMIQEMGGKLVRLYRDRLDSITDYSHITETELDEIRPEFMVRNDKDDKESLYKEIGIVLDIFGGLKCH